jgi:hypothetical protein
MLSNILLRMGFEKPPRDSSGEMPAEEASNIVPCAVSNATSLASLYIL